MAKRKKGSRRGRKNKAIPIAIMGPVILPALTGGFAYNIKQGNFTQAAKELVYDYSGVIATDQTSTGSSGVGWNPGHALPVWLSIGGGVVVHKVAGKTGVNRYIRRATMGFLEL